MWWVAGLLMGAGVVVLVAVLFVYTSRKVGAWEERIKQDGELLLCWIASADKSLYEESNAPGYADARVVFSPTSYPDLKKRLKEATRRLSKGDSIDEDVDRDLFDPFYDKVKAQRWLHSPLRLPKWLVGDIKAYTAIVQVYWRRLPENRLTLDYLYCYVLLDENGGVVMGEYPDED